jgi:hypothetical protein
MSQSKTQLTHPDDRRTDGQNIPSLSIDIFYNDQTTTTTTKSRKKKERKGTWHEQDTAIVKANKQTIVGQAISR